MEQASPVEVIVLDEVSNIEGVIMSLKSGLKIPSYAHGKIIFAAKNDTGFEGVLCDTGESLLRQRNPELVALRDDIYTLPYYKLSKSDILNGNMNGSLEKYINTFHFGNRRSEFRYIQ